MNKELNKLGVICDIPLSQLVNNEGQIDGVPKNPRYIKEDEYNALKQSLTASPELLEYKPLMVYKQGEASYVTICGNMRLRAISELAQQGAIALDAVRCFVLHDTTPVEKIKEYAIKDNVQLGNWDWDELANNSWELDELQEWGLNCAFLAESVSEDAIDDLFDAANDAVEKTKDEKVVVSIPSELIEQKDEIKSAIEAALTGFNGIKVK